MNRKPDGHGLQAKEGTDGSSLRCLQHRGCCTRVEGVDAISEETYFRGDAAVAMPNGSKNH